MDLWGKCISRIPSSLPSVPLPLSPPPFLFTTIPLFSCNSLNSPCREASRNISVALRKLVIIYLGLFIGVPHKGERIEGHLLNVADATEHFFVVGFLRNESKKRKTFDNLICMESLSVIQWCHVCGFWHVKSIPMSMTLCLAVGWRACQWFQKRSCISGVLSFSNTAITTVCSGEQNEEKCHKCSASASFVWLHETLYIRWHFPNDTKFL